MSHDLPLKALEKDSHFVQNARKYLTGIGTRDLFEDGMLKVLKGATCIEEVLRVTGQADG